jgi:hypothetical protein
MLPSVSLVIENATELIPDKISIHLAPWSKCSAWKIEGVNQSESNRQSIGSRFCMFKMR